MARLSDLEARVLDIARRVQAGTFVEDARFELKATWPESSSKFARQLAGACNAAYGDDVHWIIGLDETRGLLGTEPKDLAHFWPAAAAHFDQLTPDLIGDMVVPVGDKTVVVLVFSTSRAPYVVQNPQRNQPGAGPIEVEVPWREGTRTRSARREDLIRMLVPTARSPSIELVQGNAWFEKLNTPNDGTPPKVDRQQLHVLSRLYVVPKGIERLVFPFHKAATQIGLEDERKHSSIRSVRLYSLIEWEQRDRPMPAFPSPIDPSQMIRTTGTELVVNGPGMVVLHAYLRLAIDCIDTDTRDIQIKISLEWREALDRAAAIFQISYPHSLLRTR